MFAHPIGRENRKKVAFANWMAKIYTHVNKPSSHLHHLFFTPKLFPFFSTVRVRACVCVWCGIDQNKTRKKHKSVQKPENIKSKMKKK